ncbi:hypothetical protein ACFWPV_35730 [Streptomyces uncialis]|uniref:hypothetical protein n=1 Tax=Streptomyces uncialis TaxID=1048205 RepID=UPI003662C120
MAEHDADREDGREPEDRAAAGEQGPDEAAPLDDAAQSAAWEAIVAGYGEEPPDPPGAKPFKSVEDLALLEAETNSTESGGTETGGDEASGKGSGEDPSAGGPGTPLGGSVTFAPGVGGPRDHSLAEPSDDDFEAGDEGHFVPPEPPPLPDADATAKFAWLGLIGGPLLLLLAVLLGWEMTWWLSLATIGGFLGGFATLVARMKPDDEDEEDPGRGAVV